MKKKILFLLFLILFLVQVFVPLSMIIEQENLITKGKEYKVVCELHDPKDLFRGSYLNLTPKMDISSCNYKGDIDFIEKSDGHVNFETTWNGKLNDKTPPEFYVMLKDINGFISVIDYSKNPPKNGNNYLLLKMKSYNHKDKSITFAMPIQKFFANENDAKVLENEFRRLLKTGRFASSDIYLKIFVRNGKYVVRDLYINEKPYKDFLMEEKNHN